MLRLTAYNTETVLTDRQIARVKYMLVTFIPARRCNIRRGPGVEITVPGHGTDELAPGIRADIEATIGCTVRVEDVRE